MLKNSTVAIQFCCTYLHTVWSEEILSRSVTKIWCSFLQLSHIAGVPFVMLLLLLTSIPFYGTFNFCLWEQWITLLLQSDERTYEVDSCYVFWMMEQEWIQVSDRKFYLHLQAEVSCYGLSWINNLVLLKRACSMPAYMFLPLHWLFQTILHTKPFTSSIAENWSKENSFAAL